ncbi:hypothetical protein [Bradyrhizobium sp. cf659]|uniref:hypothetical protein n=1 Tax=Bradyrhizobium sp. cf659 TaxID=1761771 RepID=UPI0008EB618D|nr:hypothetical protein [Bradyrhizobium sp. cf659]SFJ32490.1 hypothetical protein SAMN04487925_106267 [Bradyrhizobium sp. cf659]
MANCQYIADSARLPQPHILRQDRPASTSAKRARVLEAGTPPSSATKFMTAA